MHAPEPAWVDTSLRVWLNLVTDKTVKYALPIPVDKQGKPDFSGIAGLAAQMAKDWCALHGLTKADWLCARLTKEIESDARAYVNWVLNEQARLAAKFWEAVDRELEAQLKKADELLIEARKWRKELNAWVGPNGFVKSTVECHGHGGGGGTLDLSLPDMPEGIKTTYNKIIDGLFRLPGAVEKGISAKSDEMLKGIEFGFRAAGVVVGQAGLIVLQDVAVTVATAKSHAAVKTILAAKIITKYGPQRAQFIFDNWECSGFWVGKGVSAFFAWLNFDGGFQKKAVEITRRISSIKNEIHLSK